ncbi:GNAT family N-acetyltransferase [Clostridium sp. JS66]|uniref:GNAT family N-acetyltransferase n=1 Tax=Clostridium sp. JS66 TaxID=3064705 RepID=UPI00298D816F|nr:GNAT family N-acetyltransferase [Clostridium sp. JS66]WPC39894.1 GNAT family N-acetyltransferase [Clostridium sp. JS66]
MKNLFLSKPDKEYQKSFEDYVLSYKKTDDDFYFNFYKKALENFDEYLNDLHNYYKGINLPQDWVRTSTFWLIDNSQVVGAVRIRHQDVLSDGNIGYDISPCYRKKGYGTQILKLALVEAEKIGMKEVMVTCNIDNIYSKKIIEKNNSKLLETIFIQEENEKVYRYSISLS